LVSISNNLEGLMADFDTLLAGLRRAEHEMESQLGSIRGAITALQGGGGQGSRRGRPVANDSPAPVRKRRKMSAKARAAISAAQKARWAKQKSGKKS
jgi:hypothetical protein